MGGRAEIVFLLNGKEVRIAGGDPTLTLLDFLRETSRLTGTKEGCREGDCGACTVVVITEHDGHARIRAVNSCILFLPSLDRSAIFTVEGVARDDELHPVQQELLERHGSQCGFCTPGFVMSLFAADLNGETPSPSRLNEILSGNLCRCTGYRPIIDAANAALGRRRDPDPRIAATLERLRTLDCAEPVEIDYLCPRRGRLRYSAPRTVDALVGRLARTPGAVILAGGTDVGLWVTKQHRPLSLVVDLNQVAELQDVSDLEDKLVIGAGVTYNDARPALCLHFPELAPLIARLASEPIRNSGTIGGNIANGSPIGDTPPPLIALGAKIVLRSQHGQRTLPLEDFFIEYGKQDRNPDELLTQIEIPKLAANSRFRTFKISKRFDQDISALCGAFHAHLAGGRVRDVRICFGGMAGTPRRAANAEREIEGTTFGSEELENAVVALTRDYAPMSDHRASAQYRMLAAQNLLRKFHADVRGEPVVALDREFAQ